MSEYKVIITTVKKAIKQTKTLRQRNNDAAVANALMRVHVALCEANVNLSKAKLADLNAEE